VKYSLALFFNCFLLYASESFYESSFVFPEQKRFISATGVKYGAAMTNSELSLICREMVLFLFRLLLTLYKVIFMKN